MYDGKKTRLKFVAEQKRKRDKNYGECEKCHKEGTRALGTYLCINCYKKIMSKIEKEVK